jgi:hypothetical protein
MPPFAAALDEVANHILIQRLIWFGEIKKVK